MMISENILKTILSSITNYFKKFNLGEVTVYPSFLTEPNDFPSHQYSGIIKITGPISGIIYLSAPSKFLQHILRQLNQPYNEEYYIDLVSEMSNIFAGNLRRLFGKSFSISVPLSNKKNINELVNNSQRACVIPIEYKREKAILVIVFEKMEVVDYEEIER